MGVDLMDTMRSKSGASGRRMKENVIIDAGRVRAAVAREQAASLKRGVPIHYSENGVLIKRRPDGSTVEVERPVSMDCDTACPDAGREKKAKSLIR